MNFLSGRLNRHFVIVLAFVWLLNVKENVLNEPSPRIIFFSAHCYGNYCEIIMCTRHLFTRLFKKRGNPDWNVCCRVILHMFVFDYFISMVGKKCCWGEWTPGNFALCRLVDEFGTCWYTWNFFNIQIKIININFY